MIRPKKLSRRLQLGQEGLWHLTGSRALKTWKITGRDEASCREWLLEYWRWKTSRNLTSTRWASFLAIWFAIRWLTWRPCELMMRLRGQNPVCPVATSSMGWLKEIYCWLWSSLTQLTGQLSRKFSKSGCQSGDQLYLDFSLLVSLI